MGNVLVLIVLYEEILSDATAAQALQNYAQSARSLPKVLFFDNSFTESTRKKNRSIAAKRNLMYVSLDKNVGLARAYQYAFKKAIRMNCDYLMLLDQDTAVTNEYFDTVALELKRTFPKNIVALVPQVSENAQIFEPVKIRPLYSNEIVSAGVHKDIVSINSGTVLDVHFLNEIGGFNEDFPLDYLDHWLFYTIAASQKSVLVLDTIINQKLSVHRIHEVSKERYLSIIQSERDYILKYRHDEIGSYYKHIFLRVGKMVISGNFDKAQLNVKNVLGRLK